VGRLAGDAVREGSLPARLRRLGDDLSIWQALYAAGLVGMLTQLLGQGPWPGPAPLLAATLGAHGIFLLDRVKLAPGWLDPADAAADPRRDEFIRRHGGALRLIAVAGLAAGAVIGGVWVSWIAAAAVLAGAIGVLAYAGLPGAGPHAPRVKSIPFLKNLYVGAGLTWIALACVVPGTGLEVGRVLRVGLGACLVVTADAILCDLDDAASDRAFGIGSIPARLGPWAAWWIAVVLTAAAALPLILDREHAGARARTLWSILLVATTVGIAASRASRVKSIVDLRLPALAVAIGAILAL